MSSRPFGNPQGVALPDATAIEEEELKSQGTPRPDGALPIADGKISAAAAAEIKEWKSRQGGDIEDEPPWDGNEDETHLEIESLSTQSEHPARFDPDEEGWGDENLPNDF